MIKHKLQSQFILVSLIKYLFSTSGSQLYLINEYYDTCIGLLFVSTGGWLPPLLHCFSQTSVSTADASVTTQGEAVNQMSQFSRVITANFSSGVSNSLNSSCMSSHNLSVHHILVFIKCSSNVSNSLLFNNLSWLSIKFVKICQFIMIMTFKKMHQNQSNDQCQLSHTITLFINFCHDTCNMKLLLV